MKHADSLSLYRWKYVNTPQITLVGVADLDNEIVGIHHIIVYNAKIGSDTVGLAYADDYCVDNDYRGLGISGKLSLPQAKTVSDLTKYTYLTTVNPIILKSYDKSGRGVFPFPVTRMVKINDIDLHLRMRPVGNILKLKYGYIALAILNNLRKKFTPRIKRVGEFGVVEVPRFDEKIDYFWEKIKDDYNFILEKKHPYLNWRFTDNERGSHIKVQAMNGDEVLGYAVFGLKEEEGYTEGLVEDLIALKDRMDVVDALFDYGCKYFDDLGVNAVYYQVVEGHPYQRFSVKKGFLDSRSKPYISFDYSSAEREKVGFIEFKDVMPDRVYFGYAETV